MFIIYLILFPCIYTGLRYAIFFLLYTLILFPCIYTGLKYAIFVHIAYFDITYFRVFFTCVAMYGTIYIPPFTKNHTRHNSADSVPTSNLVCITEVAIRTILCIAQIIYYTCNLITDSQCIRYRDAFNKRF